MDLPPKVIVSGFRRFCLMNAVHMLLGGLCLSARVLFLQVAYFSKFLHTPHSFPQLQGHPIVDL